jgi:hypothetical protein
MKFSRARLRAAWICFLVAIAASHAAPKSKTFYVTEKSGVVLRKGPSKGKEKIRIISYGEAVEVKAILPETVTIQNVSGNWMRVKAGGAEGWMFGGFLRDTPGSDGYRLGMQLNQSVCGYRAKYDFSEVKKLLAAGADPNIMYSTPTLHCLAEHCNLKEIDFLVSRGANVAGKTIYAPRDTVLTYYGVRDCKNYPEIIAYFQAKGLRVDTYQKGETLYDQKRLAKLPEKIFYENIAEQLLHLCQYGDGEKDHAEIRNLLLKGAPVNYRSPQSGGTTALMMAAHYCNRRTIVLLVERGAEINLRDDSGNTVFHHLKGEANAGPDQCSAEVYQYLKSRGGNPAIRNFAGELPEGQPLGRDAD